MDREKLKGHIQIGTANVLFGISIPIFKYLLSSGVPPEAIGIMRSIFACFMFWIMSLFVPREKVKKKDLLLLVACGLCGVGFNQYLFVVGLKFTSAIDASIISTSVPIFVLLLSAIVLKEAITTNKILGILIGLSGGMLLITCSTNADNNDSGSMIGNVLQVTNCLMYSIYLVISKPLSLRFSSDTMMKWMFLFSSLTMAPLCIGYVPDVPTFNIDTFCWIQLGAIVYLLFGATFIAFMLIPMSLKRIRPTTVSMYIYIQPIITSFIAITVGQERFSAQKLVSAFLVFTGVYLVSKSKRLTN